MKAFYLAGLFLFSTFSNSISAQQTDSIGSMQSSPVNLTRSNGSDQVYKIKPGLDIPVTLATVGWSLYGMSVIYGRDKVPESELNNLSIYDVNSFDRPVTKNYDLKAKSLSDKFFYGSMPLPLLLLVDKKIRKDGLRVGLLFLEAMGTTGTIYTATAMSVNRFRPYAYNTTLDLATRQRGGARNSFPAGHPAVVATSTFFMAKVFSHYHPEMKAKWVLYTLAGAATATTAVLRVKAGQHFYSDVITGVTLGTLSGILIPQIHKNKNAGENKWSFYPNYQGDASGITAIMKIGSR